MNYTKEVSQKLNDLLTKNYDAEAGYKLATEQVNSSRLKGFFSSQQEERYNFGHELKEEIKSYGESPEKGTSLKGDAHRTWMNLKSTFTSNNEEAILEEAVRGEKTAVEEYNQIITETTLPPSTKNMLIKHRDTIQNALTRVSAMEEIA
ncbi:PA2169 family four-helix-bundle protein [uncultured Nonlabens sp.]|uniref:ferritin-like domain-containing protein n=1 Tax=uncultured Nonlabens sp. TaxID=859306 RepID=UPI002630D081|nr:PA2169 family four-helix-bundle protein [uncultured Nonlabens sp.]